MQESGAADSIAGGGELVDGRRYVAAEGMTAAHGVSWLLRIFSLFYCLLSRMAGRGRERESLR
jgi:hypothetical protein